MRFGNPNYKSARDPAHYRFRAQEVDNLTEQTVSNILALLRWESLTEQECPSCGLRTNHYRTKTAKRWTCKGADCRSKFDVLTGTIFSHHRLKPRHLLKMAILFVQDSYCAPALPTSADAGVSEQTCRHIFWKFREAIMHTNCHEGLSGYFQVDGCDIRGKPRHENEKSERVDYRVTERENPSVIVSFTQIDEKSNRPLLTRVIHVETEKDIALLKVAADSILSKSAIVVTDDAPAMEAVREGRIGAVVNHSEMYSDNGCNTNNAESFNARLMHARMEHQRFGHINALMYATDVAWRNDNAHRSVLIGALDVMQRALRCGPSLWFYGWWKGKGLPPESCLMRPNAGYPLISYPPMDLVGPDRGFIALRDLFPDTDNIVIAAGIMMEDNRTYLPDVMELRKYRSNISRKQPTLFV